MSTAPVIRSLSSYRGDISSFLPRSNDPLSGVYPAPCSSAFIARQLLLELPDRNSRLIESIAHGGSDLYGF
ncbi:MAG: hypothetical protein OXC53_11445, partial [Rhodobacteraceae bacterium]|nr:hypothetical protein [Paracoccaceae bacterium]